MDEFEDIRSDFKKMRELFRDNVRDRVGASIDSEQFESYEHILDIMVTADKRIKLEMLNINRLLLEARAILPEMEI